MSDMDPCEYMWNHEMAMRRILAWLRESQSYCTDTECFDEGVGVNGQGPSSNFLMMSIFIAFALVMYFIRPDNMRNTPNLNSKPHGGNGGASGSPPPTGTS